jgi:hypothetical protein
VLHDWRTLSTRPPQRAGVPVEPGVRRGVPLVPDPQKSREIGLGRHRRGQGQTAPPEGSELDERLAGAGEMLLGLEEETGVEAAPPHPVSFQPGRYEVIEVPCIGLIKTIPDYFLSP